MLKLSLPSQLYIFLVCPVNVTKEFKYENIFITLEVRLSQSIVLLIKKTSETICLLKCAVIGSWPPNRCFGLPSSASQVEEGRAAHQKQETKEGNKGSQ